MPNRQQIDHRDSPPAPPPVPRGTATAWRGRLAAASPLLAAGWRRAGAPSRFLLEVLIVAVAFVAYFGVRGLTEGDGAVAVDNAWSLIELEESLGLYREPAMQGWIIDSRLLVDLLNWIYIWGHWPVIAIVAGWLYTSRHARYVLLRDAFFISGGIGLVVFLLYPVAPPRLLEIGMVDTITEHSHAYRVLQPPAIANQYAAMPSLHFGWNLLIGLGVAQETHHRALRAASLALPIAMGFTVVLTANHFILDVVAGGALVLFGLLVASLSTRPRRWRRSP
jgi:hypothetical protein